MNQPTENQPAFSIAIQVGHISHFVHMINISGRLVRAQLDFSTSWGQTQRSKIYSYMLCTSGISVCPSHLSFNNPKWSFAFLPYINSSAVCPTDTVVHSPAVLITVADPGLSRGGVRFLAQKSYDLFMVVTHFSRCISILNSTLLNLSLLP